MPGLPYGLYTVDDRWAAARILHLNDDVYDKRLKYKYQTVNCEIVSPSERNIRSLQNLMTTTDKGRTSFVLDGSASDIIGSDVRQAHDLYEKCMVGTSY